MNLKRACAVTAGKYGFGGNATNTANTEADVAYEQSVQDFFCVWQESNDNIRVNRYQHTIATTATTGTNDVPGYDQSHTSTNISNSVSNTTTDAEPAPKLEK